jgi:hypothetical protein
MMQTFTLQRWLGGALRRTWIVTAVTVVSCAAFAAHAAAALVGDSLVSTSPAPAAIHRAEPARRPDPPRRDGGQLLARNMFCSSCGPALAGPAADFTLQPAVLIETSVGSEPRATLRVVATEVQGSWGLGDLVPGLGQLDRIAPKWVELVDPTGHRGRLLLLDPAAGRGSDTAMSESPPAATPWAGKVKKLDDQTYEVDRELVRDLVSGMTKPGAARFVPIVENGEIKGVRLFGVTPTTIPYAIGLQSRDTLAAIDGEPVKSPQQVINLYAKLDQVNTVELSGTRDGKPLVRTLHLR